MYLPAFLDAMSRWRGKGKRPFCCISWVRFPLCDPIDACKKISQNATSISSSFHFLHSFRGVILGKLGSNGNETWRSSSELQVLNASTASAQSRMKQWPTWRQVCGKFHIHMLAGTPWKRHGSTGCEKPYALWIRSSSFSSPTAASASLQSSWQPIACPSTCFWFAADVQQS